MVKSKRDGIFGTPPEPIFNEQTCSLPLDLLEDSFCILAEENKGAMRSTCHKQGFFKNSTSAEFVFLTCDKFRLRPETKYLAVELFDRFMVQHIQDLYQCVKKSKSKTKSKDWAAIQERIRKQITLRIVSCCQLASKLTSHYKVNLFQVITPHKARVFLTNAGHRYYEDSILQSELRILKTLEYRVAIRTPIVYLETILEIMGGIAGSDCEVKIIHGISLKVLDMFYLRRQKMYSQLYQMATGSSVMSGQDRLNFVAVENDFMLLAVAVIAASSYIIDQQDSDKVIKQLVKITKIPQDDILDFAAILVQDIISEEART
ncbi:cyclin N-terminal domain-containing protein 1-like [Lineus longissimus]|uniref:cyclin N-terminal domain-containing protein 1-like n=1 Tax=Lineus longissimus TaxID=88925 RepID=UPI00315D499C